MRTLLYILGVAAALTTLTFFTLGIWTNDSRWAITAFLTLVASAAAFCSADYFPKHVPHTDRCNGC